MVQNSKIKEVQNHCDKILRQIGCNTIELSQKESSQKKFFNFIRDFGVTSFAKIDFNYKNFRYFSNITEEKFRNFLFAHATTWYGKINGENKLYFVSQPYRSIEIKTPDDVISMLFNEKGFLDFCKEKGHRIIINFDNYYNWCGDGAFLFIVELESEGIPQECVDITTIDWGVKDICQYWG